MLQGHVGNLLDSRVTGTLWELARQSCYSDTLGTCLTVMLQGHVGNLLDSRVTGTLWELARQSCYRDTLGTC